MRRILPALIALFLLSGAVYLWTMPSDRDHAAVTTPEFLADFADPPGIGVLDGVRFDTTMGPPGNPDEITDFVQFDRGLFMSQECTDRCNYPPSAYLTRQTDSGTAFIVEAFCPTKDTTVVWRGTVQGDAISGTVTWTSKRLLKTTSTQLVFEGSRSAQGAEFAQN